MNYKTPQEAIDACEAECERSWQEFLQTNKFDLSTPEAVENAKAAKIVFRVGYMAGARFISTAILQKLMTKANIIQPDQPV